MEYGKNDKLIRSYKKFISFFGKIETQIKNNYKKKFRLEITIKFNKPENPNENSSYYDIDCLYNYKLNKDNNKNSDNNKNYDDNNNNNILY